MNYKAGDTVVCIDSKPLKGYGFTRLTLGQSYVVRVIHAGRCVDVGLFDRADRRVSHCRCCGGDDQFVHSMPWRFVKLEPPAIKARTEPALVEAE